MIFLHRLGGVVPKIQHLIQFTLGKLMNILVFTGHGWTVKKATTTSIAKCGVCFDVWGHFDAAPVTESFDILSHVCTDGGRTRKAPRRHNHHAAAADEELVATSISSILL